MIKNPLNGNWNPKIAIEIFELLMLERDDIRKLKRWNKDEKATLEKATLEKMEQRITHLMKLVKDLIQVRKK